MIKKIISLLLILSLVIAPFASGCQITPSSKGAILNMSGENPITLDPALSGEMSSHEYVLQIFSGLVALDEKMNPIPDIASSWGLSADGLTYTFKLRQGVKFQNGNPVTARDFKYSWERALTPATGSRTAPTYLNDIAGAVDMLTGRATELAGVRVIDDLTLEVRIDAPKSYFLWKLSYPTAFVVDQANVRQGGEWWRAPNGTGPFKLKQWDNNRLVVLERNSLYYRDVPMVDSVVFQLYAGNPIDLFETGKIDVAGVSTAYIDKVSDKAGPFAQGLHVVPEMSFFYIGFNCNKAPFDDPDIRRAFTMAVDKDRIISITYRDMVQKAYGVLPPGIPGYNETLTGVGYDVAKAKQLIAASKYGDASKLPPITITTSGYGGMTSGYLEALATQWRENLGVEVKIRQLEPERFLYHLDQELDSMWDMGWIADYPHPQDFIEILFRSGTVYNYGGYRNPAVDALLDAAAVEKDTGASLDLYRQAERQIVDDAACIPLWSGRNYYVVQSYVRGYAVSPLGFAMLNTVSMTGTK